MGSQLSEPRLPISEYLDEGSRRHVFGTPAGKDVVVTGVLLQEKAKLPVQTTFPNATTLCPCCTGFRSRFTKSELQTVAE